MKLSNSHSSYKFHNLTWHFAHFTEYNPLKSLSRFGLRISMPSINCRAYLHRPNMEGGFLGAFDPPLEAAMYCHLFVLGYIRISLTCFAYFCGAAMMKMLFHAPPNSSSSTQQQQHPAATSVPATAIANKTSEKSLTHSNLKGVFNCVNLTPFTAHQPRTNFTPLRNPWRPLYEPPKVAPFPQFVCCCTLGILIIAGQQGFK